MDKKDSTSRLHSIKRSSEHKASIHQGSTGCLLSIVIKVFTFKCFKRLLWLSIIRDYKHPKELYILSITSYFSSFYECHESAFNRTKKIQGIYMQIYLHKFWMKGQHNTGRSRTCCHCNWSVVLEPLSYSTRLHSRCYY